jgi:hypothetical protein
MIEKFLIGLFGSIFLVLTPTYPLIFLVGMFIMADTFFGVYASYKLEGRKSIRSRKMARLISKLVVYTGAILLVFGLDTIILSHFIGGLVITKLGAGILCFIEGFSIDEKIRKINNDKGIVYYLTMCFKFLKGFKDGFNEIINGK